MDTTYLRPPAGQLFTHEWEVKRSRFITTARRVVDEDDARDFLREVKATYPDARHNCSAYIVHVPQANPIERSSDDGEPSGTAGRPMLLQLQGSGMLDIAAVVTRYFGGIKLGAGGLVHAYSESVGQLLPSIPRIRRSEVELYTVSFDHAHAGRWEGELRARGIHIVDVDYGAEVTVRVATLPGGRDVLAATVAAITQGTVTPRTAGHAWIDAEQPE